MSEKHLSKFKSKRHSDVQTKLHFSVIKFIFEAGSYGLVLLFCKACGRCCSDRKGDVAEDIMLIVRSSERI
jgi:hypothetical protein